MWMSTTSSSQKMPSYTMAPRILSTGEPGETVWCFGARPVGQRMPRENSEPCGFQRVSLAWTKMVRHPSVIRLKACPWPTGQVSQKLCRFRKLADMAKTSLERKALHLRKTMSYDFICYMQTVCKIALEERQLRG